MQNLQCSNCHSQTVPGQFCSICGARLALIKKPISPAVKFFSIGCGGLFLIFMIVFVLIFLNTSSKQPASPVTTKDLLADSGETASGEKASASTPSSKWHRTAGTSSMDDSKTLTYMLDAENEIQGWLARKKPALIIRCKEGKPELYINIGMSASVEYGGGHTVRLRFDNEKVITAKWSESTNNEALFAKNPVMLIKKTGNAETMIFEVTPFNANTATVKFDVRGFKDHLNELGKACNIK